MASAAGWLRNFREQITVAIADSDAEIRGFQSKLDEARGENERLRTLALADGIIIGSASIHLMDAVAGVDDDDEERAA